MICSVTKVLFSGLWILGFATCCLGWPMDTKHRKSYTTYDSDYALPLMMDEDAYETNGNQWEFAQEPEYDRSESSADYYEPQPIQRQQQLQYLPINPEIEALANILLDTKKDEEIWGQIIRERPETELEELKQLSGSHDREMEKRGSASSRTTATTSSPPIKIKVTPSPVVAAKIPALQTKTKMAPSFIGQKEFPLLRPPVQAKARETATPVLTQRSIPSDKKTSPYDTLRKYLSIEDALKKEAEKRTASKQSAGSSRQVKRSFIAETDSLTSQLNKLKSPTSS